MNKKICFDCATELEPGTRTREQIPAKSLFDGYDSSYKNNIITVPSCSKCNNATSDIDEYFRDFIGTINNHEANAEISRKAVRGIIRKDPGLTRLNLDKMGHVIGVEFKKGPIYAAHKKNFKGLFYHQYGYPLPKDYEIIILDDEKDWNDNTMSIIAYLKKNFQFEFSGHPAIFDYILQPYFEDTDEINLHMPLTGNEYIMSIMRYNNSRAVIAIAFVPQDRALHDPLS